MMILRKWTNPLIVKWNKDPQWENKRKLLRNSQLLPGPIKNTLSQRTQKLRWICHHGQSLNLKRNLLKFHLTQISDIGYLRCQITSCTVLWTMSFHNKKHRANTSPSIIMALLTIFLMQSECQLVVFHLWFLSLFVGSTR